jgi:RNA polymerase sigma-70 factor, ECF subfamily
VSQVDLDAVPDVELKLVLETRKPRHRDADEHVTEDNEPDPDAELVSKAQHGDLQAFEELVSRHTRRLYRMLVAIIKNADDARDAVQDTFLNVFEHIGGFQGRSKFSTWLTSIANNTALRRLREQKRLQSLSGGEEEIEFRLCQARPRDTNPEQLYSQAERRKLVETGLRKVPSKYRIALELRELEQLSTEEAAALLGLGLSAFKGRLFRARLMLHDVLSPHFTNDRQRRSL